MAQSWDKARENTRLKERDLDAEFEQFLDESLSDDRLSPQNAPAAEFSVSPRKSRSFNPKRRPWWDDDKGNDDLQPADGVSDVVKRLMKSKSAQDATAPSHGSDLRASNLASMSRDSLEASNPPVLWDNDRNPKDEYEVLDKIDPTSDNEDFSRGSQSRPDMSEMSSLRTELEQRGADVDTVTETEEKNKFFKELYDNQNETLDFAKLNQQLDAESTMRSKTKDAILSNEEQIPATTGDTSSIPPTTSRQHSDDTDAGGAIPAEYSDDQFEEEEEDVSQSASETKSNQDVVGDDGSDDVTSDRGTEDKTDSRNTVEEKKINEQPSTMLSKVSLMDSLDSTTGRAEFAAKRQNRFQSRQSETDGGLGVTEERPEDEDTTSDDKKQTESASRSDSESQGTSTLAEMNDLQLALAKANDLPPDESTLLGGISLSKTDLGLTDVLGFDSKPAAASIGADIDVPPSQVTIDAAEQENSSPTQVHDGRDTAQAEMDTERTAAANDIDVSSHSPVTDNIINIKTQLSAQHSEESTEDHMELRGFDLKPASPFSEGEDSPPTDSLRSIKEIAKKRRENAMHVMRETIKAEATPTKAKPGSFIPRPKSTVKSGKQDQRASQATPKKHAAMRTSTPNSKSPGRQLFPRSDRKPDKPKVVHNVMSSKRKVKTTKEAHKDAAYLKTYTVINSSIGLDASHVTLSDLETSLATQPTEMKPDLANTSASIARERALQSNLQELQIAFREEHTAKENLLRKLELANDTWQNRLETQRIKFAATCQDLEQKIYVLQSKVNPSAEHKEDENISDEQQVLLKNLDEQEVLLRGYQLENERLCTEVKALNQTQKSTETKMFAENQKLASEVARLKEKMESVESQRRSSMDDGNIGSAFFNKKISHLENQIKYYQDKEAGLQNEVGFFQGENEVLHRRIKLLEKDRIGMLESDVNRKLSEQDAKHKQEVSRLQKKVSWYTENQELLDNNKELLSSKSQEIDRLKSQLAVLNTGNASSKQAKKAIVKGTDDAKKQVKDLERQVKEMEEIIRRRHPNSLPALIYAASEAKGVTEDKQSADPPAQSATHAHLEKKIKHMEMELKEKDSECLMKLRATEQRYNTMSAQYQDHVARLEKQLQNASAKASDDDELNVVRAKFEKEKEHNAEMKRQLDAMQEEYAMDTKKGGNSNKRVKGSDEDYGMEMRNLRKAVKLLQKEREAMLAGEFDRQEQRSGNQMVLPQFIMDQLENLTKERVKLRDELEDSRSHAKQQEQQLQYEVVSRERSIAVAMERLKEQVTALETHHVQELERLKVDFALEHSSSKVAELSCKLTSQEAVVQHLQRKLSEFRAQEDASTAVKVREQSLQREVTQLKEQLAEAESHHTPEMQDFRKLQSKIILMEKRHAAREHDLKDIINRTSINANTDGQAREERYKEALRAKSNEVERFREQLDGILEVLSELHRQGVVLPDTTKMSL